MALPSKSFADWFLDAAYYGCKHSCCSWSYTSYWQSCPWSKVAFLWEFTFLIANFACKYNYMLLKRKMKMKISNLCIHPLLHFKLFHILHYSIMKKGEECIVIVCSWSKVAFLWEFTFLIASFACKYNYMLLKKEKGKSKFLIYVQIPCCIILLWKEKNVLL